MTGWKTRPNRQMMKKASKQMRREHKATVTLAVVLGCSSFPTVIIIPFSCFPILLASFLYPPSLQFGVFHRQKRAAGMSRNASNVPCNLVRIVSYDNLTWQSSKFSVNSSLNPLIYTIFDQRFRRAFRNVLSCGMAKK